MTSLSIPPTFVSRPLSPSETSSEQPRSSRNFVSEVVDIVTTNARTQRYDLLDNQLYLLAMSAPQAFSADAATRYDTTTEGSEHLQKLHREAPELLVRWKQGYKKEENGYDVVDIERAKQLGVSLLAKAEEESTKEQTTLQSFKSKTPFEYVDALGTEDPELSIKTDEGYEIPGCEYVYKHA